jgi:hypothetical protein
MKMRRACYVRSAEWLWFMGWVFHTGNFAEMLVSVQFELGLRTDRG